MSLLELFCDVDDFCIEFEPKWRAHLLNSGMKRRNPSGPPGWIVSE